MIKLTSSEEIYHNLFDMNGKEFVKAKKQLWLSKEELGKNYILKSRVEEFRKKILKFDDSDAHKKWVNDLINKILLGEK